MFLSMIAKVSPKHESLLHDRLPQMIARKEQLSIAG
jgi:hypothetical protein